MIKLLYVSFGGMAGALLRYATSSLVNNWMGISFPYGTFTVNMIGSFLIGLLWGLSDLLSLSSNMRMFLFVGFLGSFTTFSTFALESLNYIRDNQTKTAIINILVSNTAGILLALAGLLLARILITSN